MGSVAVTAPFAELASLLDEFQAAPLEDLDRIANVVHLMKLWCGRMINDRERNAFEQPAVLDESFKGDPDAIADKVLVIFHVLLKDDSQLGLLGEFIFVLDTLRSTAESSLEN
jgi:hypothetical protein